MTLFFMRKANTDNSFQVAVQMVSIDEGNAGQRIDNFLISFCKGVPKSHLYKAIRAGEVRVNKGRVRAEYRLQSGDLVRVPPLRLPRRSAQRSAPPVQFPIAYEDDALLVVDKPAGVAVHGGSGVSFGLIEQLRAARPEARFLELAHRLDKETSGLLIVAKKRQALVTLQSALREGKIVRQYQTVVAGDWLNDRQHLRQPLFKWLTASGERRVRVDPAGKVAHSIATLKKRYGRYSLLDVELRTGRTHQIRVHLAHSGFPIVGDDKYGSEIVNDEVARRGCKRMLLHAAHLGLAHPLSGDRLELTVSPGADFHGFLDQLEAGQ